LLAGDWQQGQLDFVERAKERLESSIFLDHGGRSASPRRSPALVGRASPDGEGGPILLAATIRRGPEAVKQLSGENRTELATPRRIAVVGAWTVYLSLTQAERSSRPGNDV